MTTYTIKPLVWISVFDDFKTWNEEYVVRWNKFANEYTSEYKPQTPDFHIIGCYTLYDEAKAAAQEHYESRLKQCLEPVSD